MSSTVRRVAVAAIVAALGASLVACGSGEDANATAGTKKLTISATGVDSLPFMAMLQVGIDKGWFKEEGIDVSLYSGSGGGSTLRVVTSGDADMAIAGNTSIVLAAAKSDSNLTVVAPWFQVNDFSWIGPKNVDPKGAKFGFSSAGSSTELVVKSLQKKLGVVPQAVGGMGDNWTAAKAGQIAAGWSMQPFTASKQADGAKVLTVSRDVVGDMPADLVAVNKNYASANPENLKAFFKVADKINKWIVDDPTTAAKDLAPLVKVTPEIMATALKQTPELAKAYSLKVDPATLENLSKLMVEAGQIDKPVDWKSVLDQQYLPEADQTKLG